jgi:hypothetical protein
MHSPDDPAVIPGRGHPLPVAPVLGLVLGGLELGGVRDPVALGDQVGVDSVAPPAGRPVLLVLAKGQAVLAQALEVAGHRGPGLAGPGHEIPDRESSTPPAPGHTPSTVRGPSRGRGSEASRGCPDQVQAPPYGRCCSGRAPKVSAGPGPRPRGPNRRWTWAGKGVSTCSPAAQAGFLVDTSLHTSGRCRW